MKAFLMHKDQDFNINQKLPWNGQELIQDLELNTLFNVMAQGDDFLLEIANKSVLSSLKNVDTIIYRQNILKDCIKNNFIIRELYNITVESIEKEKKCYYGLFSKYPNSILNRSTEVLQMLVKMLEKLKNIADEHDDKFESEGFKALFVMIKEELNDEYISGIQNHLKELKFKDGILISAKLGKGNKGVNYTLCKQEDKKQSWIKRILSKKTSVYNLWISDRDESGFKALSELKDRGINSAANALAKSADHILSFFNMLRIELAFYVGCLNLYEQLIQKGESICFPSAADSDKRKHYFNGLYDVCLALKLEQRIIGNDVNADNKDFVIITGANQGGKSTFLRSIGVAQLMMQCGMFVPAESFSSNICDGLFTHYRREEDTTMNSGKLDEELSRMSNIIDNITSNSMLLFNESFAATNEREGSEIAKQIVYALLEKSIKIVFVTHLYDFAHNIYNKNMVNTIFMRAERKNDGERTFKIIEGEPLETSYGEDLYKNIFGRYNA
jgi:DNA mismatch repair ATPase MutS